MRSPAAIAFMTAGLLIAAGDGAMAGQLTPEGDDSTQSHPVLSSPIEEAFVAKGLSEPVAPVDVQLAALDAATRSSQGITARFMRDPRGFSTVSASQILVDYGLRRQHDLGSATAIGGAWLTGDFRWVDTILAKESKSQFTAHASHGYSQQSWSGGNFGRSSYSQSSFGQSSFGQSSFGHSAFGHSWYGQNTFAAPYRTTTRFHIPSTPERSSQSSNDEETLVYGNAEPNGALVALLEVMRFIGTSVRNGLATLDRH